MASIRSLKSDIHFLTSELVTQAYLSKVLFKVMDDETLSKFVLQALKFNESFIAKVNHPDAKKNPKMLKAYFLKVRKDMVMQFEEMVVSLNQQK
jgi:hypothetical protein